MKRGLAILGIVALITLSGCNSEGHLSELSSSVSQNRDKSISLQYESSSQQKEERKDSSEEQEEKQESSSEEEKEEKQESSSEEQEEKQESSSEEKKEEKQESSSEEQEEKKESSSEEKKEEKQESISDNKESQQSNASKEVQDSLDQFIDKMTLKEKVAQLFMIAIRQDQEGTNIVSVSESIKKLLKDYPVGGVILFKENIANKMQVEKLIEDLQQSTSIPLFIGVDEEGGSVSRVGSNPQLNMVPFKEAFTLGEEGSEEATYKEARRMGKLLKTLGFNMDFAPVADIYNEPSNTVIGRRSFGTNAKTVVPMVLAFAQGLKDEGILPVIKHFPGHGSTKEDSHTGMAYVDKSLQELEKEELVPFTAALHQGIDGMMKGHLLVGAIDSDKPASLSQKWQVYLEEHADLSQTLIVTDALEMGAITNDYTSGEMAVLALEAGDDILLMPSNLEEAYQAILTAIADKRISEERINTSVRKILSKKIAHNMLLLS